MVMMSGLSEIAQDKRKEVLAAAAGEGRSPKWKVTAVVVMKTDSGALSCPSRQTHQIMTEQHKSTRPTRDLTECDHFYN